MGKFLVRLTIVITTIYFLYSYYIAQFYGIDILSDNFLVLFELCVLVYTFGEGRYHCKYIKHTALGIILSDILTRLDNEFDFLTVTAHNLIPIVIIVICITFSICSALHHFYKVRKLKRKRP